MAYICMNENLSCMSNEAKKASIVGMKYVKHAVHGMSCPASPAKLVYSVFDCIRKSTGDKSGMSLTVPLI